MQQTVAKRITCKGLGIHSGEVVTMVIKPAPANTGFQFLRTDLKEDNIVRANYDTVTETALSTTVSNDAGAKVSTIEHLMSAFWGCGIDNAIVEIDSYEVPIMDGSSAPFIALIEKAGVKKLNQPRRVIEIIESVVFEVDGKKIELQPADDFSIEFDVDFKVVGKQSYKFSENDISYPHEISRARTFGYVEEVEYLKSKGLARGASLDNAIGISKEGVVNPEGLRYKDEFVRHKVLDCIGDLYLACMRIKGKVKATHAGHYMNNQILRKLFSEPSAFRILQEIPSKLVAIA